MSARTLRSPEGFLQAALIAAIHTYRHVVSPFLPPSCRFDPTCSRYALDALQRHGAVRGGWLALKRVLRCHPLARAGHDPVP